MAENDTQAPDVAAEADAAEEPKTKTYYLREGKEHHVILRGEARVLNKFGDRAELTDEQFKAFKDKFLTEPQYKAEKAGRDTLDEAQAAEDRVDFQPPASEEEEESESNGTSASPAPPATTTTPAAAASGGGAAPASGGNG